MEAAVNAAMSASATFGSGNVKVQKLVVMSMFGAGDSFLNLNFLMRWVMKHTNMLQTWEDQNLVDQAVKAGPLPFVLVRPAMLTADTGTEATPPAVNVYGNTGQGSGFMPSVGVRSAARFLVEAAVKSEFDGKTPVVAK
jgi:hypothetical protein